MDLPSPLTKSKISVDQLDQLMAWVQKTPVSRIESVFAVIQLVAVLAYVWARAKLQDDEAAFAKQEFERQQATGSATEIASDNLDGA